MNEGDIVYINYNAWIVAQTEGEEDRLFETTTQEVAEKNEIFDENTTYKPTAVLLGKGMLFPALEKAIMEKDVEGEGTIEVLPEDGAGERDSTLVKRFSLTEFKKNEIDPMEGMTVTIKGRTGVVLMVSPGRVVVDFNNPLAGRTVRYDFAITKVASEPEEKASAILDMHYGKGSEFTVALDGEKLDIGLPEACKYDSRWFEVKFRVVSDLRKALGDVDITFSETYLGKKEETPVETPEEVVETEEESEVLEEEPKDE